MKSENVEMQRETRASERGHLKSVKVVFVTLTNGFGGAERHLIDLIHRLDPTKNNVSLYCLEKDAYSGHFRDSKLPLKIVTPPGHFHFLRAWKAFRAEKADVIVFVNGGLGVISGKTCLAAKLSGAKHVIAIEHLMGPTCPPIQFGPNYLFDLLRILVGGRTRRLIGLAMTARLYDATICVSRAIRNRLIEVYGYPAAKTTTVLNGIDTARFVRSEESRSALRQELNVAPDELLLLCVARLERIKGIDILLPALKALDQEGPRWKCAIVGEGQLEDELVRERDRLGLSGLVQFVGFRSDVKPYYDCADLLLLPSRNEGLPFVLLEAMAAGLPCIATNVGGNTEVISHGENGLIVPPESVESLAAAIKQLLCDSRLRQTFQEQAGIAARQRFEAKIAMGRIMEILSVVPLQKGESNLGMSNADAVSYKGTAAVEV